MSDDDADSGTAIGEKIFESGSGTRFLYATATPVLVACLYLLTFDSDRRWLVGLAPNAFWLTLAMGAILAFPIGYLINALSYFILHGITHWMQVKIFSSDRIQGCLPRYIRLRYVLDCKTLDEAQSDAIAQAIWDMRPILKLHNINFDQERALAVFCRNTSLTMLPLSALAYWDRLILQGTMIFMIAPFGLLLYELIEYYCDVAAIRRIKVLTPNIGWFSALPAAEPVDKKSKADIVNDACARLVSAI